MDVRRDVASLAFPRLRTKILGGAVALTLAVGLSWFALPGRALAELHPGGDTSNPVILNIDIARPAVVRIETVYTASLSAQLCPGVIDSFDDTLGFTGTGAFISANGDILTADHLVNAPQVDIALSELSFETPTLNADMQTKCSKVYSTGLLTYQQTFDYFYEHPNLFNVTSGRPVGKVWLDTGYVGSYPETSLRAVTSYPLQVSAESSFNKNDVAIIHINLTDTPSIALGKSTDLSPTDSLSLIGFPGNGDVSDNPTDFLTESVNTITVSAIKRNQDGVDQVIQVGGNVEQGDSGGPALNARGEIVGVVSFGLSQFGDTRFLQASANADPLITQLGLNVTPGKFQAAWRQAMQDYAATTSGHWHTAASEFQAIATDYPRFNGVKPYLTYAQSQATNEVQPSGQPLVVGPLLSARNVIIGASGLVLLLALGILIFGLTRRRGRPADLALAKPAQSGAYPPSYSAPYPMYPPPVPVAPGPPGDATAPRLMTPDQRATVGPGMSGPWPGTGPSGFPGSPPPPWGAPSPPQAPPGSQAAMPPALPSTSGTAVCANGHPLAPNATFCPICGAARA